MPNSDDVHPFIINNGINVRDSCGIVHRTVSVGWTSNVMADEHYLRTKCSPLDGSFYKSKDFTEEPVNCLRCLDEF